MEADDRNFILLTRHEDGMYGVATIDPPVLTFKEAFKAAREHIIASGSRDTIAVIQDVTTGRVMPVNQMELDHPHARAFSVSQDTSGC